jgi:hypothetical protein
MSVFANCYFVRGCGGREVVGRRGAGEVAVGERVGEVERP